VVADVVPDLRHLAAASAEGARNNVGEARRRRTLHPANVWGSRRLDDGDLEFCERSGAASDEACERSRSGELHLRPRAPRRCGRRGCCPRGVALHVRGRLVKTWMPLWSSACRYANTFFRGEAHDLRAEELAVCGRREPRLRLLVAPRHSLPGRARVLHLLRQEHRLRDDLLREGQRRRHVEDVGARVLGGLGARQRVAAF